MPNIPVNQTAQREVDMNDITDVKYVYGVGKNSGKKYQAIKLTLTNGYQKLVFLEQAEQFMFNAYAEELEKTDKQ